MNIQIDRQNDVPRITEPGKLVYSEKSDTLFIRTLKEGIKAIGGNTSVAETDPVFTAWLSTPPNLSEFNNVNIYFTTKGTPSPFSIVLAFFSYLLMLLSWFITKRDSRSTGALTTAEYEIVL